MPRRAAGHGKADALAGHGIPTVVVAAELGVPKASTGAGVGQQGLHRHPMTAPHWPAAMGARAHVEGHGLGTYVGFDFDVLARVAHTIDFDEGGEQTLTSDFPAATICSYGGW